MKCLVFAALVVLTTSVPVVAEGRQRSPAAHMRPQLFHDRTPRVHTRATVEKRGK